MQAVSGANFLAGLHSLFIGQSCRLEQRFAREIRRVQNGRLSPGALAGLHSLFIGQSCRLEQRFTREFRRVQKPKTSYFYFSIEFLGCVKCECFAGVVSHCKFALCVATKLAWVGACISPGLQNTSLADCVAWERGGYAETRPAACMI